MFLEYEFLDARDGIKTCHTAHNQNTFYFYSGSFYCPLNYTHAHAHAHTKHYFHIRGERAVAGRRDPSFLHLLGWLAAISPVSSWSSFSAFCCVCSWFLYSFIHEYTLTCCLSVYRPVQMDRRAEFSLHLYIMSKLIFFQHFYCWYNYLAQCVDIYFT